MKLIKILVLGIVLLILWNSCVYHDLEVEPADLKITLRWVQAYPDETKENVVTGLGWALSFLGAALPAEGLNPALEWKNGNLFYLNLEKAGFQEESRQAWKTILDTLKSSDEYKLQGGIDVGRFIILTLNSANHYYAITGAEQRYADFRIKYNFDEKKAGIVKSTIAFGSRVIEISKAQQFSEIAFVANEGEGSIESGSFVQKEFEALDFMTNGQLRFALYDINGNLKTSAGKSLTAAGKPSKCLWCHETSLISPFVDDNKLSGYYSTEEFKNILANRMEIVNAYRGQLSSKIFLSIPDHTKAELLYLSFMEPSLARLSQEWGMSLADTKQKLDNLPTHPHHEFPFLGEKLYNRNDVDHLAPFKNIEIPTDPRNPSAYEPDFIH
jgi:hypothetical protein